MFVSDMSDPADLIRAGLALATEDRSGWSPALAAGEITVPHVEALAAAAHRRGDLTLAA